MDLHDERRMAEVILEKLPADEEELAISLCISREHVASLCTALMREGKIKLNRSWDAPRHWQAA